MLVTFRVCVRAVQDDRGGGAHTRFAIHDCDGINTIFFTASSHTPVVHSDVLQSRPTLLEVRSSGNVHHSQCNTPIGMVQAWVGHFVSSKTLP